MKLSRLLHVFLGAALFLPLTKATTQTTTDSLREIAITHVTLVDVSTGKARPDMTVIVAGNRISFVGHSEKIPASSGRKVIDARSRFLIPGLWDMHDHALSDNRYGYSFPLLIANGVTGIREMGSNIPLDDANRIRRDVEIHRVLGPRFGAMTYRLLDGQGTQFPAAVEVTDPNQARALVRTYKSKGADFIKPYNLLRRDVYLALVDEAGKQRIPVAGHVPFSMTVREVSDLGQRSVEHNFDVLFSASRNEDSLRAKLRAQPQLWPVIEAEAAATYDEAKAKTLFARLARNRTWSCPTIAFYRYPSLIRDDSAVRVDSTMKYVPQSTKDQWHATFERVARLFPVAGPGEVRYRMRSRIVAGMHRAGVRILAGTDAGAMYSVHGFSLHDELEAMVTAGLSPLDALRTATINPAKFLGRERDLGTIEKGKLADLVLLDANPLDRISNTRRISAVVVDGLYLPREALNGLLTRAEEAAREQPGSETRYVDVGGFKLRMVVAGSGSPTVVFDSGFGDGLEVWDNVAASVSRFARVVAYDRAGIGKSEAAVQPRTFTQIAKELHTLLERGGITPPYVMVGHSMGGATIRAFAALYRQEIAGLVFVDPLNERLFDLTSKQDLDAELSRQEASLQNAPPGVKAEWNALRSGAIGHYPELRAFGKPPDVPSMLLIAGRDRPPVWAKSILEQYGNWMVEASEGGIVYTPDNSHYIHSDEPSVVVSAIRRVVFPSVRNRLARAIARDGTANAIALYRQMKSRYPAESFNEGILNSLGYQELGAKHVAAAIELFKLNVEMYPDASNPYDSLGEAYMAHGDRELAITNYRKSLALNPNNTNAVAMLRKLGTH